MRQNAGGARLEPRPASKISNPAPIVSATSGIGNPARKPIGIVYALTDTYDADVHLILPWTYVPLLDGSPGRWCPRDSTWRVSKALSPMVIGQLMRANLTVVVCQVTTEQEHRPPNGLNRWGAAL